MLLQCFPYLNQLIKTLINKLYKSFNLKCNCKVGVNAIVKPFFFLTDPGVLAHRSVFSSTHSYITIFKRLKTVLQYQFCVERVMILISNFSEV